MGRSVVDSPTGKGVMSDQDAISRRRSEFVKAFNDENIEAMAALIADDQGHVKAHDRTVLRPHRSPL